MVHVEEIFSSFTEEISGLWKELLLQLGSE